MSLKKKRGRPPTDNPATEKLSNVRVTLEQLNKYSAAASKRDEPMAAWVKRNLDKAAELDLASN